MENHSLNLKEHSFLVWSDIKIKQRLARTANPHLLLSHLIQIIEIKSNSNIQDRALILFSWASATRRSEIVLRVVPNQSLNFSYAQLLISSQSLSL